MVAGEFVPPTPAPVNALPVTITLLDGEAATELPGERPVTITVLVPPIPLPVRNPPGTVLVVDPVAMTAEPPTPFPLSLPPGGVIAVLPVTITEEVGALGAP
jgi:hypothetical protein